MPKKKKPTLNDLARVANVSPATVSRVIASNSTVDPIYRNKVRDAAKQLGIDLEDHRKNNSRIIAFLMANRDVSHSFQTRILLGAETYFSQRNWEMLFMSFVYAPTIPPEALHLPQILNVQTNARGVILSGSNYPNLLQALRGRELPFVVLGNNVFGEWDPRGYDVVYSDDVNGARTATLHLISKGHRGIAFIGNLSLPWYKRCAQGYREAMTGAGLEDRSIDLRFDGYELGYIGTKAILAKGQEVTAILAGNDQVAAGVYEALRESSISIPNDMSVIGFNDTQSYFQPQLTSVREFPEELGRHMAELVLNRITQGEIAPQQVTTPTMLVSRDSVSAIA